MTVEQMCEVLGISTKTGYRLLREKKICCLKVGRAYRIPKAHLFTYLCIGGEETSI
ncbi:helix-turn-helix domain-containing protein [Anaerotignum faecicola]